MNAPTAMLTGSCHCAAVQWRFHALPDGATACNCTICRRYAALWIYGYEGEGVAISGTTTAYIRGEAIEFHHCPSCGCTTHWRSQHADADGRRRLAVNVRLCDPADVATLPIDLFDGLDSFRRLPRDGRCVADYWPGMSSTTDR